MIKHIVLWRLNGETPDRRLAQAMEMKQALEALNGHIAGLRHLEIGIDFNAGANAAHVALYAQLDSREALAAYQVHPEHVAAKAIVAAAAAEQRVVDYEA